MSNLPALAQERNLDASQWNALKNHYFPKASDLTVALAVDYCRVRGLDIMKKPVHIISYGGKEEIVAGIAEYRTTAARTGQYAGIDAPVYVIDAQGVIQSCNITVYRLVHGVKCGFVGSCHREMKKSTPIWNSLEKRMFAIRAETDALRKAFPEEIGSEPTFEEMEAMRHEQEQQPKPARNVSALLDIIDLDPEPTPEPKPFIDHRGVVWGEGKWKSYEADLYAVLEDCTKTLDDKKVYLASLAEKTEWLKANNPAVYKQYSDDIRAFFKKHPENKEE